MINNRTRHIATVQERQGHSGIRTCTVDTDKSRNIGKGSKDFVTDKRHSRRQIRAKRLAKLQAGPTSSNSPTPSPASPGPSSSTPVLARQLPHPKQKPPSTLPQSTTLPPQCHVPLKRKSTPTPTVDYQTWENDTMSTVLKVTLSKTTAEANEYDLVWLKHLQAELESEGYRTSFLQSTYNFTDIALIACMTLMSDIMDHSSESLLASLPPHSVFEYLVGCWKRINTAKSTLLKKNSVSETQQATALLDKLRDLIISYTGLNLSGARNVPATRRLLTPLLSLSTLSTPLYASTTTPQTALAPTKDELLNTLSTIIHTLVAHSLIMPSEGISGSGGNSAWHGVIGGMEALVGVKPIADMITKNAAMARRGFQGIVQIYFSDPTKHSRVDADVESLNASLRGTLKSLQSSLFQTFNTLVRTSPEAREWVLEYFATVVCLNVKCAGMQDGFMVSLQSVLLRFAEPFMDARYTKMDPATPNFISDIFYLCNALGHYGYICTIQVYEDLGKTLGDYQRRHDMITGDGSWMGTPQQAHVQAAIDNAKNEMSKIQSQQLAYHFIIEDVVEFFLFVVRHSPESLNLSGKDELVIFALTFLTSTWYIKNPFLKANIHEAVFYSVLPYGNNRHGIWGHMLNTHPVTLKNLIPALTHFYIEVEQMGASSQFYDKFTARNIAYILKAVWDNPVHRDALNKEAQNVDKFIRFINLMINDVTYLMDESLSELTQIHNIQAEMHDQTAWNDRPQQYRHECEGTLRGLERHASGYITLGRSTVSLLKDFTAETKGPFMMPKIMDKLAAMLDYNLDALKYKFNPRQLLSDILQVYINLSDQEEFVRAVANDGRSYRKELRVPLKTEAEIGVVRSFVSKVEEMKTTIEAEEDLGEVPEEFLDPLMAMIMRDPIPITLPSSRAIVDRLTIKSHLLSDSKDPFNWVPMLIEDVISNVELKAQIDVFITERRNKRLTIEEGIVKMDVSTD
ncbi:ubiquitin elongating factor core-domain-containing protein [Suillus subalutaceus]|uniref:ubiquitin elongating factor core-domain-containing protein n=1 Tax=Suillus subalutaceus TaxID=48586 RepID=UPI001B86DC34|nr:ubiquitin elongating factor core-domain-containing protein [Suillus subalutaceus]KAG1857712.1 ubiquitin elongating factor core-domain-containing protein [Suillus subalutaceus]